MESVNLLTKEEYNIYIKRALEENGFLEKSYSHKPHLASLPYDLANNRTVEQLEERKQAVADAWKKQRDKMIKKYPKEIWNSASLHGLDEDGDIDWGDMETHKEEMDRIRDLENGVTAYDWSPDLAIQHYDDLLALHGVVYDTVRERYSERIDYIKDEMETLKEAKITTKEGMKKLEERSKELHKLLEDFEKEGIAQEDYEAIYGVDLGNLPSELKDIEYELENSVNHIKSLEDRIGNLDSRRKQLTQAMPKKTKIPKDSPYYDLWQKRALAYEFKKDCKIQQDYQSQLVKINYRQAQLRVAEGNPNEFDEGIVDYQINDSLQDIESLFDGIPDGWLDNTYLM